MAPQRAGRDTTKQMLRHRQMVLDQMDFKQKAEEKKMSMSKNIARLAVTAGLTAALSFGGVMAPVTMAFAAEGGSTVTFEDSSYSTTTTYKGIQIFTADVDGATVKNIQWAGSGEQQTTIQEAVVDAINEWSKANNNVAYTSKNAQNAAEWLNTNAQVNGPDSRIANDNVLNIIAKKLNESNLTWETTAQGNSRLTGLGAGYWLFLTNGVYKPADGSAVEQSTDAFTSPIFKLVNGTDSVNITPKKKIPTVEKKIVSDKDSAEYDAADSHVGQNVTYNLYGTIADNYATYDSYFYKFSDQISKGLTLQKNSAKVYLYDSPEAAKDDPTHTNNTWKDITADFIEHSSDVDSSDGSVTTTWTCSNLKTIQGVTITKDSCIVVSYTAQINENAVVGLDNSKEGNPNTVTLYYSNNPMTTDYGQTVPDTVRDYTYGLKINKVDLGTESALNGAKFTIKVKSVDDADNADAVGKFVQSDGKIGTEAYQFETTIDGTFTVKGLDTGTYTVEEVEAPRGGYTAVNSFDFTITPELSTDPDAKLNDVKYALNPNGQQDQIIIGTPNDVRGDNKLVAATGTTTNTDGTFNITVGDTKSVGLPLTGLNGVTFTWIAGGAVLCIGVAHLIRSRKQAEESEQE